MGIDESRTYKAGDQFKSGYVTYVLVHAGNNEMMLIRRWRDSGTKWGIHKVKDINAVTCDELSAGVGKYIDQMENHAEQYHY